MNGKWRLPYSEELHDLATFIRSCPNKFQDINRWYWSYDKGSILFAKLVHGGGARLALDVLNGMRKTENKKEPHAVRLVRDAE